MLKNMIFSIVKILFFSYIYEIMEYIIIKFKNILKLNSI